MYTLILEKDKETSNLSLAEIIPKLQHLFKLNMPLYFFDFTLSVILGNYFLVLSAQSENWSWLQIASIILSSMLLFRATAFMHEAFHQGKRAKHMLIYYNLMHGFLHKIPSYCHDTHTYHHSPKTYGTLQDPEYDNLAEKSAFANMIEPPLKMFMLPVFLIVRWGIMPIIIPFVGSKARLFIYERMSTLAMNVNYKRPHPTEWQRKNWYLQDLGCFVYSAVCIGLIIAGILPAKILLLWFITYYIIALVNCFRAMLNHRYYTQFNTTTHKLQIIDSVTLPFSVMNAAFYPVGLGYHALHHMLPQIPYHNLGKAHRLLIKELPNDHPYRLTVINNYYVGLKALLQKKF